MSIDRALPVIIPSVSKQRWSCHQCAQCCRTAVVHLFDADCRRIDEQGWSEQLDGAPYVRVGRQYVLNERDDGACVFLDSKNQCRIHARFGEQAKPIACRMFPFSVRRAQNRWQASLRFDCPSVARSEGAGLTSHQASLEDTVAALGSGRGRANKPVTLTRGRIASDLEQRALTEAVVGVLYDDSVVLDYRLIGLARVTTTLFECHLDKVCDDRFAQLVKLLFEALACDANKPAAAPGHKQARLFRQLIFAHTEHVSLGQLRSGVLAKLGIRATQLKKSQAYARGVGVVPPLAGTRGSTTFEAIEAVLPDCADEALIAELWQRYLLMRVKSGSVFGLGYYGWTMLAGFSALWLAIAASGYLARWSAAAEGRTLWGHDDLVWAIGVIDAAVTRAPALGTLAERARVKALLAEDGLVRLLNRYASISKRIGR